VSQIEPLSSALNQLNDDQRKAVFYRLEHERPVDLGGTDLKPLAEPGSHVTLVVPKANNLEKFAEKVRDFGHGPMKGATAPNARLVVPLTLFTLGRPTDRLSDSMLEQYVQLTQSELAVYEIEIQSVQQGVKQRQSELVGIRQRLEQVFKADDYVNQIFEHEDDKGTSRIVVRTTGRLLKRLVEDSEWQTSIVWFDLKPQFETFHATLKNFDVTSLGKFVPPEAYAPTVCVIDSGVTAGNPFIMPVVKEELFRSYLRSAPENVSDEAAHGTGVASLVSYYSLNIAPEAENYGRIWIASARISDASNHLEEDRLFSLLLRRVVEDFVPLGVRIFNLSINNRLQRWSPDSRRTIPRKSWVARALDRLSREYDVLFIVSTGNLTPTDTADLLAAQSYPAYFSSQSARLLDPAQAALALTVGSLAATTQAVSPKSATAIALAPHHHASPFTRVGPGIRGEIKPELVDYGGNYFTSPGASYVFTDPGANVMMASNKESPALMHDSGTSYAAPRVAFQVARIFDGLSALRVHPISANLLRAFAVNSALYPSDEASNQLQSTLGAAWRNVLGYGTCDAVRALQCDEFTAIMFYQGESPKDQVAFFSIPIPASLSNARTGRKRITVTVAFAPEVQRWGLEEYTGTRLRWRLFRGDKSQEEIIQSMSVDEEEASSLAPPPDRPGELTGEIGFTQRSRGCIQHDWFEWSRHRPEYSASHYTLAIASFERWDRASPRPVPFSVVIKVEELSRTVPIYAEIEQQLSEIRIAAHAEIEV
jgi:hypothetical protein